MSGRGWPGLPFSLLVVILTTDVQSQVASAPTSRPAVVAEGYRRPANCRRGGYLGLFLSDVVRADGSKTVLVERVSAKSDAERVGFRNGDEIVAVDGRDTRNGDHFIQQIWRQYSEVRPPVAGGKTAGSKTAPASRPSRRVRHTVSVLRQGEKIELRVGLADLDVHPALGDQAPTFVASTSDGKSKVDLAKMIGQRPVVLIFGSYT